MKVFAVTYEVSYEGEELEGIFSTFEKAEAYIVSKINPALNYNRQRRNYNIETHELDKEVI